MTVHDGRNETELERWDRNLSELLQEVRVAQTGVQVLFAFLLMAPLTPVFDDLGATRHAEYFVTLSLAAVAAILLIAPTAYHRLLFRCGDKEHLVRAANRLTLAGLTAVGMSMVGALVFVADVLFAPWAVFLVGAVAGAACTVLWGALPLMRRRRLARERADESRAPLRSQWEGNRETGDADGQGRRIAVHDGRRSGRGSGRV